MTVTKAKITLPAGYKCAPQGHTVITIPMGETVTGDIAEWAIGDGAAQRMFNPVEEAKIVAPAETKRGRGRPRKATQ